MFSNTKNGMNKRLVVIGVGVSLIVSVFAFVPNNVSAQDVSQKPPAGEVTQKVTPTEKLVNPLKTDSVKSLLMLIVDLAMNIGIILAVLMIIYAGFKFVLAQGNPEAIKDARNLLFAVIIGLAVLIAAKTIVSIIQNTLIQAKVVDEKVFKNSN